MTIDEIRADWNSEMAFTGKMEGHDLVMDGPVEEGGRDLGVSPKPLLLTALAGCSGMSILSVLRRVGKRPDSFFIQVRGTRAEKLPHEYTKIHIRYTFEGDAQNIKDTLRAIDHSEKRYCGVSVMLSKIVPITYEVYFNGVQIFDNRA